jgi:hypothetical protein
MRKLFSALLKKLTWGDRPKVPFSSKAKALLSTPEGRLQLRKFLAGGKRLTIVLIEGVEHEIYCVDSKGNRL